MKRAGIIFSLALTCLISFSQVKISDDVKNPECAIQVGLYYKTFFGKKYIEPTLFQTGDDFKDHQYERYNKVSTVGFDAGWLITHRFNRHWGITSGAVFFLRRDIFENSQDTIIKYGNGSSMRDIHNVLKYNYSYNNIEIPIMVQYRIKKFRIYSGFYFSLISCKSANYTYVMNQYPSNVQWTTSDKKIVELVMPIKIYPTLQISYGIKTEKFEISPFMAFYYAIQNQNDLYFSIGMNFWLNPKDGNK